uniref:Uncharacterized protein n=1 Tax=Trypanosoma vivax (strain Y486) TaxID=1055687 RepID=G0U267_TRYVY|nr:conserved hypothetical protein [Trypanosoma vivax Y486]
MPSRTCGGKTPFATNAAVNWPNSTPLSHGPTDGRCTNRGSLSSVVSSPPLVTHSPSVRMRQNNAKTSLTQQKIQMKNNQITDCLQREFAGISSNKRHNSTLVGDSANSKNTRGSNSHAAKADGADIGSGMPLSQEDVLCALSMIIQKQNSDLDTRRSRLLKQRERDRARSAEAADSEADEQSTLLAEPCCALLHSLLSQSRRLWASVLSARLQVLKKELSHSGSTRVLDARGCSGITENRIVPDFSASSSSASSFNSDTSGVSNNSSKGQNGMEWSVEHLYEALVAGINSNATTEFIVSRMFNGDASVCDDGIDAFGLLTVFRAPVQAMLAQYQETLAPSLTALRMHFFALHPSAGCPRNTAFSNGETSEEAQERLGNFLKVGGSAPEALASALRGPVTPSLRRLLYARALQFQLFVAGDQSSPTDVGELKGSRYGDDIARHLSFATARSRECLRRRTHYKYLTKDAEAMARVLQAMIIMDNAQSVGDNDKYFIFLEETELLATSLILDRSVSDVQLKSTLMQMGRPPEQIHLLIAPVCYITGDTVEQYDIVSALFSQLWCRLQGPTPELLQCCWIFESLVARFAAPACLHATCALRFPPLRLAIRWMTTAFATLLEPAELLSLWDLILSYHVEEMFSTRTALSCSLGECSAAKGGKKSACAPSALWLLPLVAASIFVFRAPLVERCATADEMLHLFAQGRNLRCRPLLQYLLFMAK